MTELVHGTRSWPSWRRIGVVLLIAAPMVVAVRLDAWERATDWIDDLGRREVPPFLPVPDVLPRADIDGQREHLGADTAFELTENGTTLRAFAWEASEGNWTLVFYRREGDRFTIFGSIANPSGFDRPRLEGTPPCLRMRERALGLDMVFRLDGDDVAMVPADPGTHWTPREP